MSVTINHQFTNGKSYMDFQLIHNRSKLQLLCNMQNLHYFGVANQLQSVSYI